MILLKSFFRKKSTKIYLMIILVINIGILLLLYFQNYYEDTITKLHNSYSYFYILSDEDYRSILNENTSLINIDDGFVLEIIQDESKYEDYALELLKKINNDVLGGIPVMRGNDSLCDDEIYLYLDKYSLELLNTDLDSINEYNNNYFILEFNNESINLKLKEVKKGKYTSIELSNNLFNKLDKEKSKFLYQFQFKTYINYLKDMKKIEELANDESFRYFEYNTMSNDDYEYIEKISNWISISNIAIIIIIFFTNFILFIVINNIVNDQKYDIKLMYVIGYNKTRILFSTLINLFLLITLSIICSNIISIVLLKLFKFPLFDKLNIIYKYYYKIILINLR